MAVTITIRNVPEPVRDKLKARAERRGQSMQEFLRRELERIASKPSNEEWLESVRRHKASMRTNITTEDILDALHAGRK